MSEEKKTVELKDEELEKVSGGGSRGTIIQLVCPDCGYVFEEHSNGERIQMYERPCPSCNNMVHPKTREKQ